MARVRVGRGGPRDRVRPMPQGARVNRTGPSIDARSRAAPAPSGPPAPKRPVPPGRALRVLMLSWEYPPVVVGGLGRHVHALATALADAGHDVVVVARQPTGTDAATPPTTL